MAARSQHALRESRLAFHIRRRPHQVENPIPSVPVTQASVRYSAPTLHSASLTIWRRRKESVVGWGRAALADLVEIPGSESSSMSPIDAVRYANLMPSIYGIGSDVESGPMATSLDTVLAQLITGMGGGAAVIAVATAAFSYFRHSASQLTSKYLESKIIEPLKAKLSLELEKYKSDLSRDLETYRSELTESKRQDELFERIQMLEFRVLEEAERVVRRIDEVMHEKFKLMYTSEWNPNTLTIADLNGNKKVTMVYRLMRFYGAYRLYHQGALSLPPHPERTRLTWVVEKKIDPVFAAGGLPGDPVMFRDPIIELSEEMLDESTKWDTVVLVQFGKWVELAKANNSAINLVSFGLAEFLSCKSPRLALLGIYLIDLRQDLRRTLEHERLRDDLLLMLKENVNPDSLSIWGRTVTGKTDLAEMDLSKGIKPRNFYSPLYDKKLNPMNYPMPKGK